MRGLGPGRPRAGDHTSILLPAFTGYRSRASRSLTAAAPLRISSPVGEAGVAGVAVASVPAGAGARRAS
jgi:hypothetical protein